MKQKNAADAPKSPARRRLLIKGAVAGAALAMCGTSTRLFAAAADREIRIGYISAHTGNLGLFGQTDPHILDLVRRQLEKGLTVNGETYRVTVLDRDCQSSPSRASQLAGELISREHVHLMLVTPAPETVNPVSDACEAAGVPSIGTTCPLESFFFGRGGKLGEPSPFKWTFDFFISEQEYGRLALAAWEELKTNRKVAVMYPNDADGSAFRGHLEPILTKHGYTVIDPGPYQDGTTDYSSQIALFNREDCQIFNTVPIPPDFNAFWRQAAQLHFANKVHIAQIAKTGLFLSQISPLGSLGYNLATDIFWSPVFPYESPLIGMSSRQLADGYEKSTGQYWTQQLGPSMALFDAGISALRTAKDPTDHKAIRDAIANLDVGTTVGPLNFRKGPYPNTSAIPDIGGQWVKAPQGAKWPLELVTIEHAGYPDIPVQRKLVPYAL